MNENEISEMILDCCFKIHRTLGPGLFESVYEQILSYKLSEKNIKFERQKAILLNYGEIKFNVGFRFSNRKFSDIRIKISGIHFTGS